MKTFDVGQKLRHENQWGEVLIVEFRGQIDSLTAIVLHRESGGQYACKMAELTEVE